jgi:hypothetical protein
MSANTVLETALKTTLAAIHWAQSTPSLTA